MTDDELLAAHVAGDPNAFTELFLRHRDRLWAVALRTVRDPEVAADCLQEAMIAAFRRAGTFRGDAAVTSWLHRIVVNSCLDRIRRETVRRHDTLPESPDRHPALVAPDAPERAAIDADRAGIVDRALDELNPDQRAAVVLVDMEGLSVVEAAEELGVPTGTVKSRCSRGRARLAQILGPMRDEL
ncbi:RNA polymerase sigma factor SigM [Acidipropionibacterium timonense]|uniref:RNA polymerase sigma factor SigM n=1 Tax=Acidipropionibacterium timonense TaxID=2161818 RepID=UPI00102FC559|nr:RNA polymerase sigma factor SigM [Acidipropionibacterium timonense]